MFVCSVCQRWWSVHTLLSLWVVVEQVPPPWSRLRELMLCDHSDPLLSVCFGGHFLWSRINLEAALFFLPYSEHNKGLYVIFFKLTTNPVTHWLMVVCSLVAWKGNNSPFQLCGSALFILCCKWIWRVTVWLWPGVVLSQTGPNCGRELRAEEHVKRESSIKSAHNSYFYRPFLSFMWLKN